MKRLVIVGFVAALAMPGLALAQGAAPTTPAAPVAATAAPHHPRTPLASRNWEQISSRSQHRLMRGMHTQGGTAVTAAEAQQRWDAMDHAGRQAIVTATRRQHHRAHTTAPT